MTGPPLPGRFQAAVFDMDGLLVDSEPLWARAEADLLAAHGGRMTEADRLATVGRSITGSVMVYADRLGIPEATAELRAELIERVRALYATEAAIKPGAAELVGRLHGRLPLAVASNSDRELIELGLARIGLLDRFDHLVSASDVARSKPWPDVYLEACRRLGVEPRDAVGFEDSPAGIDALGAAGMTSVGVRAAGAFSLDGADHQVGWLTEVMAWVV
ncbi:MAG: hypothetical protein QOI37_1811 [Chloroflexota bacterium]|nr:hypothetical protein [Chloroflexota bacterium]